MVIKISFTNQRHEYQKLKQQLTPQLALGKKLKRTLTISNVTLHNVPKTCMHKRPMEQTKNRDVNPITLGNSVFNKRSISNQWRIE